ncbi:MAG: DUF2892 domain-containing protein [Ignavibacteriaceae bacterium]|nr:DUF2892 domain-containing protein [Ignavibacteriaceae bacterium]
MVKNVGSTDKIVRYGLGIIIIAAGLYFQSWWGVLGLVPIATALVGFCGAYTLFGVNTCKLDEKKK